MKRLFAVAFASALLLAGCGGRGDDTLGDNAADRAEAQAEKLEAQSDALDARADAVRDRGEATEEAIDEADVNAQALTPEQRNALVNAQ